MRRVLIGTDGSTGGCRAVRAGLDVARGAGAVATLAYVRPLLPPVAPHYQQALAAQLREARAAVDEAAARATALGVESESEILEGDPSEQLLELARLRDADMIVVGSRGLGAVAGALLGSVSSALVRRADRSVLVVKGDREA